MLSERETQVKSFIGDCLILQKTPTSVKMKRSKSSLLRNEETSITVDVGVNFMVKLTNAVEHRPLQASDFFKTEIYGVPACFAANHTDTIYHGTIQ